MKITWTFLLLINSKLRNKKTTQTDQTDQGKNFSHRSSFIMKLFSAALLTSLTSSVLGQDAAQVLLDRWNMDEPVINYFSDENKFVLDFPTASTENDMDGGMQEEFYDVNCKDDGSGFDERVLPSGQVTAPTGGRPVMTKDPVTFKPKLEFVVDTQALANNQYVYEVVGESENTCFGQLYDVSLDVTIEVDVDNWPEEISWDIVYNTGEVVFSQSYAYSEASQTVTTLVPNLCRGVDYWFKYDDSYGDGLDYGGSATGFYQDDVLFTKSGDYGPDSIQDGFESIFNLPLNPQNPATNIQDRDGQGMMKFCVRSSLGYDGSTDQEKTLDEQFDFGYKEVNFIESLITIFFDLTAGFEVLEFNVDPKERIETTAQQDTYELEAWLCDPNFETVTQFGDGIMDKVFPAPIADTFLASEPDASKEFFNQGALITVCVAPDDAAWLDGIRMNGITSFDWLRNDLSTTASNLPTGEIGPITQKAIEDGSEAGNSLTSYIESNCENGKPYCTFSSILFADFYISQGVVSGSGSANLQFAAPGGRRLGAPEEETAVRKLQDEAAASPFDVSVPVDLTDEGPGALKTAGGAAYGIVFTSAIALLSAALLA